jgi:hypothetical protein
MFVLRDLGTKSHIGPVSSDRAVRSWWNLRRTPPERERLIESLSCD